MSVEGDRLVDVVIRLAGLSRNKGKGQFELICEAQELLKACDRQAYFAAAVARSEKRSQEKIPWFEALQEILGKKKYGPHYRKRFGEYVAADRAPGLTRGRAIPARRIPELKCGFWKWNQEKVSSARRTPKKGP